MAKMGHIPWNKGIKTGMIPQNAFEKGHPAWNKLPVGLSKMCPDCQIEKRNAEFYEDQSCCKPCHKKRSIKYSHRHRDNHRKYARAYVQRVKCEVLSHYSNGDMKCVRCGFDDIRALSIDHVNGGGRKHTRGLTETLYNWLKRNNYPDGFQVLCMNCQFIKKMENGESNMAKQENEIVCD